MQIKIFTRTILCSLLLWSSTHIHAQAHCYCPQGMLSGGMCLAPFGRANTMRPVGYAVCSRPAAPPPQTIWVYDQLNLLWTRDNQPYFFRTVHKSPYKDFDYAKADQDALNACNAQAELAPCKHSTAVLGNACIAYLDTPQVGYGQSGNTCQEAEHILLERCMQRYRNHNICSGVQFKEPHQVTDSVPAHAAP